MDINEEAKRIAAAACPGSAVRVSGFTAHIVEPVRDIGPTLKLVVRHEHGWEGRVEADWGVVARVEYAQSAEDAATSAVSLARSRLRCLDSYLDASETRPDRAECRAALWNGHDPEPRPF